MTKTSDGVKYKFLKIFDVYKYLTPAMNEWGVNLDIVAEKATNHRQNDDPAYYSTYEQKTYKGSRLVWVYEADITIRWTNADDEEDKLEVTLHAIGTNDGGPDKAKGSAWTYCLKYYLFEKFGIDQGDDDPDMTDYSTEGHNQSQPASSNYQGTINQGQPQTSKGHKGAYKRLTDAQLNRMYAKGKDAGWTTEQVDERIRTYYKQQDPHELTRQQYDEICAALDAHKGEGGQQYAQ